MKDTVTPLEKKLEALRALRSPIPGAGSSELPKTRAEGYFALADIIAVFKKQQNEIGSDERIQFKIEEQQGLLVTNRRVVGTRRNVDTSLTYNGKPYRLTFHVRLSITN
jgi:hypothetical protein